MMLAALTLVVAGALPPVPWLDGTSTGDDLDIRLVTFGVGPDMSEWFGHSALVVEDKTRRVQRLYNYGEFAFTRTTVARYVLGRLEFHVGERDAERTLNVYRKARRSIHVQKLRLTPEQKESMAHALAVNALPENKHYLYDHFSDNCATRPRDIINGAIAGALKQRAQSTPARMTLRDHVRRHTAPSYVLAFLIDLALNSNVDQPITEWEEAFLPQELADQVREVGLVESERTIYDPGKLASRDPVPEQPPVRTPALFGIGLVVALLPALVRKRFPHVLLGIVVGIIGLLLVGLWTITDHVSAFHNENLLVTSPLALLAIVLAPLAKRRERALLALRVLWAFMLVGALVSLLLPQGNLDVVALFLPMITGLTIGALRLRLVPDAPVAVAVAAAAADAAGAAAVAGDAAADAQPVVTVEVAPAAATAATATTDPAAPATTATDPPQGAAPATPATVDGGESIR